MMFINHATNLQLHDQVNIFLGFVNFIERYDIGVLHALDHLCFIECNLLNVSKLGYAADYFYRDKLACFHVLPFPHFGSGPTSRVRIQKEYRRVYLPSNSKNLYDRFRSNSSMNCFTCFLSLSMTICGRN